jgi:DNA-directed RNA polymerase beta' subunit
LYPDKPNFELNDCISVDVDMNKLYMYGITLKNLADSIIDKYDNNDIFCVFSPDCIGVIDIYVNSNNILLPKQRILYIDEENAIDIFLEEIVWNEIQNIILFGIPNIKEFYFLKDKGTWMIETIGSNLQKLLTLPFIDETKTKSTNLWDIYNILGIEAARQFLIDQFLNIMGGINIAHPTLLADKMTFTGIPVSMSRYTMRNEDSATFQKISFEETIDNIIHSATFGQIETTNGVSASIICGKRSKIGTGLCGVKLDIDKLISFSDSTIDKSNNNIFFENDTSDNSDYD